MNTILVFHVSVACAFEKIQMALLNGLLKRGKFKYVGVSMAFDETSETLYFVFPIYQIV